MNKAPITLKKQDADLFILFIIGLYLQSLMLVEIKFYIFWKADRLFEFS